jgi:hypothetical protein
MKYLSLIIVFFLLAKTLTAQKATVNEFAVIDKKSLALPDSLSTTTEDIANYITGHFTSDKEKARAIFIWIATNIQYDVENMFAINFYEAKEQKILKPLKTRRGICENYAALFNDLCLKAGINSFVIEGYTKQNGFTDYIPHAWCAAFIDNSWYMFDPTWGSGYINGGKFYKKINNNYYRAAPASLIKSHMPFDYLWQFLQYPVTNQEFYEGKIAENKSKSFFNYQDSIQVYEKQNKIDQLVSASSRIERNGVKNAMIFDRLQRIKLELENDKQNKIVNLYNTAAVNYNDGLSELNNFIQYRNKQFIPAKPDADIQNMIEKVNLYLKEAKSTLVKINNPDASTAILISQLNKAINDISLQVKEQQDWLTVYFSKGNAKRKSMFYEKKVTWFGIPIN